VSACSSPSARIRYRLLPGPQVPLADASLAPPPSLPYMRPVRRAVALVEARIRHRAQEQGIALLDAPFWLPRLTTQRTPLRHSAGAANPSGPARAHSVRGAVR
jgi:hypothetical protein